AHLLDVRDAAEWQGLTSSPYGIDFSPRKGRILNSIWIEWYNFMEKDESNIIKVKSKENIQDIMSVKNINLDDEIIIYCFKGARASNTLMSLREAGYYNVKNYFASWNEWSRDFELPIDDKIIEISTFQDFGPPTRL
ncbi:unnamed protein product, partial [Didymodactylos carnosus]